ncbi:CCR4-associated factor 1 [Populus alba x Populus x berolinensis]|nr:CCR4-associated factor 1 [Populus alba x Populus x berolinensis]
MVVVGAAVKITVVWRQNFQREIFNLDAALFRFLVVSFDIEFPSFFRNTPIDATDLTRYEDLKHNVDPLSDKQTIAHSVAGFTSLLGIVFGDVVDIKYMTRFCQGLRGGELSLAAIAKILNVERVGRAHQSGSDSLLTACVYTKMRMIYKIDETPCMWCLYGVSTRICKLIVVPNTDGRCFISYFSTQAPFQRCIPPHCYGFMQAAPTFSHVL